jgi:hypothetical protein
VHLKKILIKHRTPNVVKVLMLLNFITFPFFFLFFF